MDQVLAHTVGKSSPIPSLVLGIEPTELRLEDGYSMLLSCVISWSSDTKPATKEIYPSRVFDMLVDDGKGRRQDRSILDEVFADASALKQRITVKDKVKLDEYLESVRDIEQRLDASTVPAAKIASRAGSRRSKCPTWPPLPIGCRRTFQSI
jgi:hypothetical protein